jgi:soluble lytic murein transglycosylase-like protein
MKKNIKNNPIISFTTVFFSIVLINYYFYAQLNLEQKNAESTAFTYELPETNLVTGCFISKTENNLLSISGKKEEHLYHKLIIQTASHHKIDSALVKAIIMVESGYNPKAISKRGAKGFMQLMPDTAEELNVKDIFNPYQNINGGVRYFKKLYDRFNGDIKLALAAYNAGSKNVRRYNGIPPFKATHHFIKKVLKYYQLYINQMTVEVDKA